MPSKSILLLHSQNDEVSHHMKLAKARAQIAAGILKWVVENHSARAVSAQSHLRMTPAELNARLAELGRRRFPYVPKRLPPVSGDGHKEVGFQRDQPARQLRRFRILEAHHICHMSRVRPTCSLAEARRLLNELRSPYGRLRAEEKVAVRAALDQVNLEAHAGQQ